MTYLNKFTTILGEIGGNHNGDYETALALIDTAKDAGCDYAKFQLYGSFKPEWIEPLKAYCKHKEIGFLATAFNKESVDMLGEVEMYKIASPEGINRELVEYIIQKSGLKTVLISDGAGGGSTAPNAFSLRCVSDYPANPEDYRLEDLNEKGFCGVSDHTTDYEIFPMMCVAAGARFIEKHFTLDKTQKGDDHPFALNPDELKKFVENIRKAEKIVYGIHKIIPETREILWMKK